MVYEMIYNQLIELFNVSPKSWIVTGVEILSFTFTTFFILMFFAIPLYAFFTFFKITRWDEEVTKRRRRRR